MKILKVFEKNAVRGGVSIKFWSDNVIHAGDIVSINYKEKERYFKVDTIETDGNTRFSAYASNYGYYDLLKKIDLRELLELPVRLIVDQDTLNNLAKESRYC